jgi:DNA-binding CsgD family transcriptional regulator
VVGERIEARLRDGGDGDADRQRRTLVSDVTDLLCALAGGDSAGGDLVTGVRAHLALPSLAAVSALSARETEVARLVAEGMTNREIAAALTIAPKTAAAHVEHIRTKLGVSRRAQIASWVAGLG